VGWEVKEKPLQTRQSYDDFRKLSLELAQRDPVLYYSLDHHERYWIELLYADMQHIINGKFTDNEQCLGAADFAARYLLVNMKNRRLSKRLTFRVSPLVWRKHFRESLPDISYEDEPPNLLEKIRRRFD
jgi:hypothetical protein